MRWIKGAPLFVALALLAGCGAEKAAESGSGKAKEAGRKKGETASSQVAPTPTESKTTQNRTPSDAPARPTSSATQATVNSGSSGAKNTEAVTPVKRSDDIGIYEALQSKLKFSLLYPGYLPDGFAVADRDAAFLDVNHGIQGFQIRYSKGGSVVTVLEGDVFNPASGSSTEEIKIRSGNANLETMSDGSYAVFFAKDGIRFGISAKGIEKSEVKKMAAGLASLSELK